MGDPLTAGVTITPLTPDDWLAYRELRIAALADAPDAFGSTLERERSMTEEAWRARLLRRSTYVARADPGYVGTAAGVQAERAGCAELVGMWVHPAWRRQGIGGLLIDAVAGWAAQRSHAALTLWVADGNEAAEALYTHHGFVRTGASQPIRDEDPSRIEWEMLRAL
ncbi:MAG TPA: GNAT family N-acetyltransferase [Candidatus Binatia bacterium]|nr:GNAT family N-acetyltransferase [Candidatus Binatia bacterium]